MVSKTKDKKTNFKSLAFEAAIIIFAVLTALAVDSWKEEMDRQEAVDIALLSITNEIKKNLNGSISALKHNKAIVDELKLKIKLYGEGKSKDLSRGSFSLAELRDIAWIATNNNQVASWIKQETLFEIGRIYHEQELLDTLIKDFRKFHFLLDPEASDIKRIKYRLRHLSMMNRRAEELIEYYQYFLLHNEEKT